MERFIYCSTFEDRITIPRSTLKTHQYSFLHTCGQVQILQGPVQDHWTNPTVGTYFWVIVRSARQGGPIWIWEKNEKQFSPLSVFDYGSSWLYVSWARLMNPLHLSVYCQHSSNYWPNWIFDWYLLVLFAPANNSPTLRLKESPRSVHIIYGTLIISEACDW
jgi:hypothetical protein